MASSMAPQGRESYYADYFVHWHLAQLSAFQRGAWLTGFISGELYGYYAQGNCNLYQDVG